MTYHSEDLGLSLAALPAEDGIIQIRWSAELPRPYGKLREIPLDDPGEWPTSSDPRMRRLDDGILPRFECPVRVVFPHAAGDRVGLVLAFHGPADLRALATAMLRLANLAEENHDPAAVRAAMPCKTCDGRGVVPDGPEDARPCPDCTPEPPPGEVVLTDEPPF